MTICGKGKPLTLHPMDVNFSLHVCSCVANLGPSGTKCSPFATFLKQMGLEFPLYDYPFSNPSTSIDLLGTKGCRPLIRGVDIQGSFGLGKLGLEGFEEYMKKPFEMPRKLGKEDTINVPKCKEFERYDLDIEREVPTLQVA